MGSRLVPATMITAMLAFAFAALTAPPIVQRPGSWTAAVSLAILGGIIPMIYAVTIRIVPVFARRTWPDARWLRLQVALNIVGAWTVYVGSLIEQNRVVVLGSALALAGAIVFTANIARLFRGPKTAPGLPPPYPDQVVVDRLATRFTRLAGIYLLVGLGVGLGTSLALPGEGRWDLVWAHALLIGFFLSMAAGVSYHVLARWTGRQWRWILPIRLHLLITVAALPLMLLALATERTALFAVAGSLQATGLVLYLATIAPMLSALPEPSRSALMLGVAFLLVGIGFGAVFALEPALGARFRLVHAQINLFGWTGSLISGISYYLVPRFAGRPLRWPRLSTVQRVSLAAGVTIVACARLWPAIGGDAVAAGSQTGSGISTPIAVGQVLIALGFLLLGVIVAGTFARPTDAKTGTVATLTIASPRRPHPSVKSAGRPSMEAPDTDARTRLYACVAGLRG